jgi:hypothetical protein
MRRIRPLSRQAELPRRWEAEEAGPPADVVWAAHHCQQRRYAPWTVEFRLAALSFCHAVRVTLVALNHFTLPLGMPPSPLSTEVGPGMYRKIQCAAAGTCVSQARFRKSSKQRRRRCSSKDGNQGEHDDY